LWTKQGCSPKATGLDQCNHGPQHRAQVPLVHRGKPIQTLKTDYTLGRCDVIGTLGFVRFSGPLGLALTTRAARPRKICCAAREQRSYRETQTDHVFPSLQATIPHAHAGENRRALVSERRNAFAECLALREGVILEGYPPSFRHTATRESNKGNDYYCCKRCCSKPRCRRSRR
jgi:hypothetical protein